MDHSPSISTIHWEKYTALFRKEIAREFVEPQLLITDGGPELVANATNVYLENFVEHAQKYDPLRT